MALEKRTYTLSDLKECDLDEAPSLDLPHLETKALLMPKDGGKYMIFVTQVKNTYRPEGGCPFCGSMNLRLEGRASRPRLIHDVVRNNMRVDIAFFPPRMLCKDCRQKFTPEVKGVSGGRQMTNRLEEFLRIECFLQPFNVLAERSGLSMTTIEKIIDDEIDKYEERRNSHPPTAPRVLGIDEKHIAHLMRGTLVDIENGYLIDMLEDNKRNTMIAGIKSLKDWDKNIEVVTTDMSNAYLSWLPDLLPNATIVIDKFHVIQNLQQSITKCRKALIDNRKRKIDEVEDKAERARQAAVLRIAIDNGRLFNFSITRLAREENDKKLKQIATVIDEFSEFKMLHNLHYSIEYMYEQTTREEAEKVWREWLDFLPPGGPKQYEDWCNKYDFDQECFEAFRSFSRYGFQRFAPYILNYFNSPDTRVTNAATEGLNSLIGDFNIDGKGYSFKRLRAKCLYASLIHERISYGISTEVIKEWARPYASDVVMEYMMPYDMDPYIFKDPVCYITKKIHTFTETKNSCTLPELNLLRDNSWFKQTLSNRAIEELERERLAALPRQVVSPDHIAYELPDPDGLCEMLAERFPGYHVYRL